MAREPDLRRRGDDGMMTSFVFRVRNIPAALYKAMGGFATNGVNMTKLESYMVDGIFHGDPVLLPTSRAIPMTPTFSARSKSCVTSRRPRPCSAFTRLTPCAAEAAASIGIKHNIFI